MNARGLLLLPLATLAVLLSACGGDGAGTTTAAAPPPSVSGCSDVEAPPAEARTSPEPKTDLDPDTKYDVNFETNCGIFTIRLDQRQSPHAAASFAALVESGYLNNTTFHRIVPGFVIQGGDPTASSSGGPGYSTVDEPPADARYTHGVVAMAKAGAEPRGTAGSQFFIVTAEDAGLDPDYAIVGVVTGGIEVVDRIGQLGDVTERPTQVVEIEKVTLYSS